MIVLWFLSPWLLVIMSWMGVFEIPVFGAFSLVFTLVACTHLLRIA